MGMPDGYPTHNVVLMDTRHHRTIRFDFLPTSVVVPIDPGPQGNRFDLTKATGFTVSTWVGQQWGAVFTRTDAHLFGDPIFYQTSGPELPDAWWERPR